MDYKLYPGTIIKTKIIGGFDMVDNYEKDPKILVVPENSIKYHQTNQVNDITQLDENKLKEIKWFLEHYKDLENKVVTIEGVYNKLEAEELYKSSKKKYLTSNEFTNIIDP